MLERKSKGSPRMLSVRQIGYVGPSGAPGELAAFPETADDVPASLRQWLPPELLDHASQMYHHASRFLPFDEAFRKVIGDLLEQCRKEWLKEYDSSEPRALGVLGLLSDLIRLLVPDPAEVKDPR